MNDKRTVTAATLLRAKLRGEKTVWLTAFDTVSARLAEEAGVDVLLVGDSLGMTCLGLDTTLPVTIEQMIHHTAAVVRGCNTCWIVCDLPFGSYQKSPEQAFDTSVQVLQQTGCDAVKMEGGAVMAATIRFLAERGVAVVAHIGLTPQSVKRLGSYRQRGVDRAERAQLLADAEAVARSGAVAVVVENIPSELAAAITGSVDIPVIGIGAGPDCDAQVLVWHDLLGISESSPPFAPAYANIRQATTDAIARWSDDVRQKRFPHG